MQAARRLGIREMCFTRTVSIVCANELTTWAMWESAHWKSNISVYQVINNKYAYAYKQTWTQESSYFQLELEATLPTLKVFTCSDVIIDEPNDYITSPGYPNYISGIANCLVQIKSKIAHGLNVYIVRLAMSDATEQGMYAGLQFVSLTIILIILFPSILLFCKLWKRLFETEWQRKALFKRTPPTFVECQ